MKVIKSKLTGYCHGVSETLNKAYCVLRLSRQKGLPPYSIGQLIHNKDVSSYFERAGLKIIKRPEDGLPGIALIRAHGIPRALRRSFEEKGYELIDATCVNIKKTQEIIASSFSEGRTVILLGVSGHAETLCLQGMESIPVCLVSCEEDLKNIFSSFDRSTPVTVTVQTTFPQEQYKEYFNALSSYFYDCRKGNTLCQACIRRKQAVSELAGLCDAVFVVGGRNSENTKDLARFAERTGCRVFCIENEKDLPSLNLEGIKTAGVCSGTSTPPEIIDAVCRALEAVN